LSDVQRMAPRRNLWPASGVPLNSGDVDIFVSFLRVRDSMGVLWDCVGEKGKGLMGRGL
jgi:hypothetical protein